IVFPVSYLNDSLLIIRVMRQQKITLPVVGGAAGYVIPDFAKALGQYAQDALSQALRSHTFDQGWAGVMSGGGVKFDAKGLNTLAQPVMVQWQDNELVSVWPQALAKGKLI